MVRKFLSTLVLFAVLTNVGLAKGDYGLGKSCLKKEDWNGAVFYLKRAVQEQPGTPEVLRDLGRAYYHLDSYYESLEWLNKAHALDNRDAQTILYLGMNYDRVEDYEKASEVYREYLQLGRKQKGAKKIRARLRQLEQLEIEKQIRAALEERETSGIIPENSITVLYFQHRNPSERCRHLSRGIAEFMTTDLSKAKKLQVVERLRLQALLDEMGLGKTGMVDSSTAPTIGKILGVEMVISGTLEEPAERSLEINSGILSVPTKDYDPLGTSRGKLEQFFKLEKELVFGIIDHLGITLTKEERDEIKKVPTENVLAFLAYCEGLSLEDQRDYGQAADRFRQARSLDPGFIQAQEKEERARDLMEIGMVIGDFEPEGGSDAEDRLEASAHDVTGNFFPHDLNEPFEDQPKDGPVIPAEVKIIIKGAIQ